MSIPLDRLYNFVKCTAEEVRGDSIVIYHFWPHGAKNIANLVELRENTADPKLYPRIICHDQEPLNFEYYQKFQGNLLPLSLHKPYPKLNVFDQSLLLHSEKRSQQCEKYHSHKFLPVYYWSHAIIAHDWFRYAQHIDLEKNIQKDFLIYNRAWSGTREYRLHFADSIIDANLHDRVLMRVSPVDSSINSHYSQYDFKNYKWKPKNNIEDYFPLCVASSDASADFDIVDYTSTCIEVVLETLFDDYRLHLTEKTLRPIALGQPFILAATFGSLQYLKDYGFKTYGDCWDESYDTITDSEKRIAEIISVMTEITKQSQFEKNKILQKAKKIAEYNKKHFFSCEFADVVTNELKINLKLAYQQLSRAN